MGYESISSLIKKHMSRRLKSRNSFRKMRQLKVDEVVEYCGADNRIYKVGDRHVIIEIISDNGVNRYKTHRGGEFYAFELRPITLHLVAT